jgi:hypothetical protein
MEGGNNDKAAQVAGMTLKLQQALMVHMGTALMLERRAQWTEETVEAAAGLISGGVLDELQTHLASLAQRQRMEGGVAAQVARFENNFDRMAIDWLLATGQSGRAARMASLAGVAPPPSLHKFQVFAPPPPSSPLHPPAHLHRRTEMEGGSEGGRESATRWSCTRERL